MEKNRTLYTPGLFVFRRKIRKVKIVRLLVDGELQEFKVQDGMAELIKAMDLKEIGSKKIRKEREVKMRDIPREEWDKIALQRYWEEENKEDA